MVSFMRVKIDFERLKNLGRVPARRSSRHPTPLVLRIPRELWWLLELKEGDEFELFVDTENKTLIYVKV